MKEVGSKKSVLRGLEFGNYYKLKNNMIVVFLESNYFNEKLKVEAQQEASNILYLGEFMVTDALKENAFEIGRILDFDEEGNNKEGMGEGYDIECPIVMDESDAELMDILKLEINWHTIEKLKSLKMYMQRKQFCDVAKILLEGEGDYEDKAKNIATYIVKNFSEDTWVELLDKAKDIETVKAILKMKISAK